MRKIYSIIFLFAAIYAEGQISANGMNPTCNGQCNGAIALTWGPGTPPYIVTVNGGTNCGSIPATYTTNSAGYGLTNLCACNYTISVLDGTGSTIGTTTVQLIDPPPVTVSVTSFTPPSCSTCSDGSACGTASGGSAPYTYTWSPAGANSPCLNNIPPGSYTFCATDANGCVSCTVVTFSTTSMDDIPALANIVACPNPASDKISFAGAKLFQIELTDLSGRIVLTAADVKEISVANLPNGVYELKMSAADLRQRQKLIISH